MGKKKDKVPELTSAEIEKITNELTYKVKMAAEKQWINYTKAQIFKVDPRVTQVLVHYSTPTFSAEFIAKFNDGYQIVRTVTSELLQWALKEGEKALEHLTNSVVKDFKTIIAKNHPLPKIVSNKPSSFFYNDENSLKPLLEDKDWQGIIDNSIKSFADWAKTQTVMGGPFPSPTQQVKPLIPKPPTPPEKDKEYTIGPELDYNKAYNAAKHNGIMTKSPYMTWGALKDEITDGIKTHNKILEEAQKKHKHLKNYSNYGFDGERVQDNLKEVLPCLYQQVKCPVCKYERDMAHQIIHLNDEHDWTREAIADWSESLDIDISVKEKEDNE